MKLPDAFNQFLRKTPEREVAYLSLVLEEVAVQAAVWTLPSGKKPHVGEATVERVADRSWEKRLEACDRAIARLAEKEGRDDFDKVVLGLPAYYLTDDDDIEHDIRSHIKTLTEELELTPIGFVPTHQAIVHMIKQEEGVPPSVILLEVATGKTTMILYKVGVVVGKVQITNDDLVPELERALKGFKDLEVLPSRVLLYGGNEDALDSYKRDLLKHPWPTRANFLHYPKIEILPTMALAGAVSLAGASELATQVGEEVATQATLAIQEKQQKNIEKTVPIEEATSEEEEDGEMLEQEEGKQELDENVVEVAPEALGFRRDVDILERPMTDEKSPTAKAPAEPALDGLTDTMSADDKGEKNVKVKETLLRFFSGLSLPRVPTLALPKTGLVVLTVALVMLIGGGWLTYWVFPNARMTILELPRMVSATSSVTVNPAATVVDGATKTVPGRKQEKTVSGDTSIAVTGKKDIGDPARGTVTIYNKTLTGKQLKKGANLSVGSLSFTLDSDVSIASASESVGSITFGKANASVTALKLGPQSNVPASTEFGLKDTPSSVMIARNDAALSGGTSKVVTVVSRADYDALVADLTKDLIAKAKAELAGSVAGSEQLIDETVKTTVTDKKFDAELDEEAKELHGSITVAITGFSYSKEDIASFFTDLLAAAVPAGYTLSSSGTKIHASNVQVKKDGTISLTVVYEAQALPTFDLAAIRSKLAGKSLVQAQEELKAIAGVGGIEMDKVKWSLWGPKLPANANNIAISVKVLE